MALRMACPACGTSFSPKPANAGRILPCLRCGSDLQMPASIPVPKATPRAKPLDLDDDLDEEPSPKSHGSLLWLWVLLGTGLIGLGFGAGGFWLLRDKPADAPVVVEKPHTPPGGSEPPKPDAPKADSPKTNPPKLDTPKIEPKVVPVAAKPAQSIPGLKFYLPLDATADGQVTEVVSGKQVGTGVGLALTDGPRGSKSLRLTHDRKNPNRFALNLSDQKDAFAIPAGRPFTLAFWGRRFHTDTNSGIGAYFLNADTTQANPHTRTLQLQLLPSTPAGAAVTLFDGLRGDPGTMKSIRPNNTMPEPEAWQHFTLLRDEQGYVWWLVNGTEAPGTRILQFPGELRYDTIGLVRSSDGKTIIDLADFCLYDRALTEAELGTLTGLKIPPRSKPAALPEGNSPAPGAVPVATDIKGLRFYLPCDQIEAGAVKEAISGKFIGKGRKLELVDGPRGKALRVTAGGPGGAREGFDLTPHVDLLAVEEGKPFTLAVWVRTEDWDSLGATFVRGQQIGPDRSQFLTLYRYTKGVGFLLQQGKPGGRPDPINQAISGARMLEPTKGWIHLALSRDDKGTVRYSVNGAQALVSPTLFTADIRFTAFSLCWLQDGAFTADFDEFCLFDRAAP